MFGKISFHKHFNIREIVMHCGFLSNSFLHLTHIVALYTFIVLLSYLMFLIYICLVFQFAHFVEGDKI